METDDIKVDQNNIKPNQIYVINELILSFNLTQL